MLYDYIIVGQGLSGSLLGYDLLKRGWKVLVYDQLEQPQASGVAAGIFNPFTGRKLVKTWMADTIFPFLQKYYHGLENELGVKVLHMLPMYRPFLTTEEQNEWGAKYYDDRYRPYIDAVITDSDRWPQVINPVGGLLLKQTGYVDTAALVNAIRTVFMDNGMLVNGRFLASEVKILKEKVHYQDHQAKKVIFCEGPWVTDNQFFNWLPMRPVKGEILEIEMAQPMEIIVNRGVFVLPFRENYCKVGATFDNRNLDWNVTEGAKLSLKKKLEGLLQASYRITNQLAGVRPASLDRRPLIGLHPAYEPLGVFNGLGTKGVSLAPYLISQFIELLEYGKPLIPEISISRYFSLYYNKI
jgi:glycine/D-amino acid oxidase-like deaminating enzyme